VLSKMSLEKLLWNLFLLAVLIDISSSQKNDFKTLITEVRRFWNEMSVQKPVSCDMPGHLSDLESPVFNLFSGFVPVQSYPCDKFKDESSIKFKFHGKIENGYLGKD
jgi:hypothetical protein